MLFVIVLSPLAAVCQAPGDVPLPQNPAPAADSAGTQTEPGTLKEANPQISDHEWRKIQNIQYGERVIVASTYGPPLHCRFASATGTALYCDAAGSPDGTGYRFERATLMYVELESLPPPPNHHPVWLSCMIAGGILVGLAATQNMDDGRAVGAGVVGAAIVGAIGGPMVLMNQNSGPPQPVIFGGRPMLSVPLGRFHLPRHFPPIHQ